MITVMNGLILHVALDWKCRMNISTFFEVTLGANLANARWSWGAYRPDTNRLFLRVWKDQVAPIRGLGDGVRVLDRMWKGRSPGYAERAKHLELLRSGAEAYGVVCTAADNTASGSRRIKEFDQERLVRLGRLVDDGGQVWAEVREWVDVSGLVRPKTSMSSLIPDLRAILREKQETVRETWVSARLGQGEFRARVLDLWGSQCCVSGVKVLDAIRASHIKPWRDCNHRERLDPHNGLPLVATLDSLFDALLITFDAEGKVWVSRRISRTDRDRLGLDNLRLCRRPSPETESYLAGHRAAALASG
jgi:putative restriction endonuclease